MNGFSYYDFTVTGGGTGIIIFSGSTGNNSFHNFTINQPKTVTFISGSTTTINGSFSAVGVSGSTITINATTVGNSAEISQAVGTVCSDFLNLKDSFAKGTFFAGINSVIQTNVTGWTTGSSCSSPTVTPANRGIFIQGGKMTIKGGKMVAGNERPRSTV